MGRQYKQTLTLSLTCDQTYQFKASLSLCFLLFFLTVAFFTVETKEKNK